MNTDTDKLVKKYFTRYDNRTSVSQKDYRGTSKHDSDTDLEEEKKKEEEEAKNTTTK
jgi:hypothetical protein